MLFKALSYEENRWFNFKELVNLHLYFNKYNSNNKHNNTYVNFSPYSFQNYALVTIIDKNYLFAFFLLYKQIG